MIAIYSVRTSLPYNPARLPFETPKNNTNFRAFFPEGFSFFTRNPREPQVEVYKLEGGRLELLTIANASHKNWFGIVKSSRAQNIETGYLLSKIKADDWLSCKGPLIACVTHEMTPVLELKTNYSSPLLCGELVITVKKPVPWAWSNSMDPKNMPTEFARILIRCD